MAEDVVVGMYDPLVVIEDWLKQGYSSTQQAWDALFAVDRAVAQRIFDLFYSGPYRCGQSDKLHIPKSEARKYIKLFREYKKRIGKYGGAPAQLKNLRQMADEILYHIEYELKHPGEA